MAPEVHAQATLAAPAGGPPQEDPPLTAGAVIDRRYRVIRLLGEGGMGRVYEAEHLFIRRRLALKLVRRDAGTGEAAARLLQEAMLAGKVPHPTIVPVFDCAALPDGQVYVAMELLRGESLEQALARPQPAAEALRWLAEVARGLAAAHRVGIVHRDVKPANVFLARTAEGRVQPKILDFGIAKLLPGGAGGTTAFVRTQAGSLLGTPFYMAPERARGEPGGPPSDLYSLGVILYEALTGAVPFDGAQFMEIVGRHVREAPLDPRQAAPGRPIPDALAELALALLGKDPAARPADGDAVARGLLAQVEAGCAGLVLGAAGEAGPGDSSDAHTRRLAGDPDGATQRLDGGAGASGAGAAEVVAGPEDRTLGPWSSGHALHGPEDRSIAPDLGGTTLAVGSGGLAAPRTEPPAEAPHGGRGPATQRVGSGAVGGAEAVSEDRSPPRARRDGPVSRDMSDTRRVGSGQIGAEAPEAAPRRAGAGRRAALAAALAAAAGFGGTLAIRGWADEAEIDARAAGTDDGVRGEQVGGGADGRGARDRDAQVGAGADGREARDHGDGGASRRSGDAADAGPGAVGVKGEAGDADTGETDAPAGVDGATPGIGGGGEAGALEGAGATRGEGAAGSTGTGEGQGAAGAGKPEGERTGKKPPRKAGTTAPTGRDPAPKIKIDVYDDE